MRAVGVRCRRVSASGRPGAGTIPVPWSNSFFINISATRCTNGSLRILLDPLLFFSLSFPLPFLFLLRYPSRLCGFGAQLFRNYCCSI
ncbi:hypothetical protein FIBSPDRAFT_421066 [Athelia psychrophila]|uniref:Uncharacterized protein n=1 Tax=Athelia psychrophila TaxID=1759441 RepID=A0A167USJ1_9AGAM|nr:hypothetical protein FIBSPDRAFT_421066 [Fibularhizoctonia sp. CBS 109695]